MSVKSEIVSAPAEADKKLGIITKRIGIVSSTTFDGTYLQKAFNAGVNDASVGYTVLQQPGTYNFPSLESAIKTLDKDSADPPLELIVTVGGLIVALAALATVTQKPFLSIVGGVLPGFPLLAGQGFFFGGVNLQTFAQNAVRVQYLVNNHGKADKNICLVYNPNSNTAGLETFAWQHATPKRGPIIAAGKNPVTGANDSSTYTGVFTSIKNNANITAVVVSADPFFGQTMNDFIDAANTCGKYICYPFQGYRNVGPHAPKATLATLYGPNLGNLANPPAQYQILGQKAISVINTVAPSSFDNALPMIKDL